jgi:ABC-type lipoprotein export system ATPase subunit
VIQSLQLENFSVFKKASIEFSPKINVIVGENGTGKTHLLKAAYALSSWQSLLDGNKRSKSDLSKSFTEKLLRVFFPGEQDLRELVNRQSQESASLDIAFADGQKNKFSFKPRSKSVSLETQQTKLAPCNKPIFFPAKEVLSFLPGIVEAGLDDQAVLSLFDDSYLDLCDGLLRRDIKVDVDRDPRIGTLLPGITNAIRGKYEIKESRLRFIPGTYQETTGKRGKQLAKIAQKELSDGESPSLPQVADDIDTVFVPVVGGEQPGHITAEGFKKLGVLQQLLSNGSLSPGKSGTLFWDEPESNVNPTLMRLIVESMLDLSRNGQQIVLATHDYVLLKWFDLLEDAKHNDEVRFHALYRNQKSGEVCVETANEYRLLNQNAISDSFAELYDEEVRRALGGDE